MKKNTQSESELKKKLVDEQVQGVVLCTTAYRSCLQQLLTRLFNWLMRRQVRVKYLTYLLL
jgi:hypothetical protein